MSKISLVNILIGFVVVVLASLGGFFLGVETKAALSEESVDLLKWKMVMYRSAHAHSNLFGMLHILMGITMPYSRWGAKIKKIQTWALTSGTLSMGVLMVFRARIDMNSRGEEFLGFIMGAGLLFALLGLSLHCLGLTYKLIRY